MDLTLGFNHLVEIDEKERSLTIYRVNDTGRSLYTSTKLPDKKRGNDAEAIKEFCRLLGENILIDSPIARKLLEI
jgi:hypothetical protein